MTDRQELSVEKGSGDSINDISVEALEHQTPAIDEIEFTLEEQRSIIWRIDKRITLVCGALYFISLLDRTNLGAANIAGMSKDLDLGISNRYNIIALIFFVPYIIFEFPSQAIVRRIGARNYLPLICFLWGCAMIGTGFVKNWHQMVGLRVLLGVFEAGYFPACIYLLSTWYLRYELQIRYAAFYFLAVSAQGFGGILAYGLMQMKGVAGINGWRWIFIMEGIVTTVLPVGAWFLLGDFPERSHNCWKFLDSREIAWATARLNHDRGDASEEAFTWREFIAEALDIKLWLFMVLLSCITAVAYAIGFFLPLILRNDMHFSLAAAQCLTFPPYMVSGAVMLLVGWLSDKTHLRSPYMILNCILSVIGLAVMTWAHSNAVRYFGVFILTTGALGNVPIAFAYQANNIRGQAKRAFGSATIVMGGGVGGIAGSLVFRSQDAPSYHPGIYACIVANILVAVITLGLAAYYAMENKKARAGKTIIQGQPGFLYTL